MKKFPRITSIETIEMCDTTLEGIKQDCDKFWAQEGKEVVIMKSDKGVTIKDLSQLDIQKPFCVRFLEPDVRSDPGLRNKNSAAKICHVIPTTCISVVDSREITEELHVGEDSSPRRNSSKFTQGSSNLSKIPRDPTSARKTDQLAIEVAGRKVGNVPAS